MHDFDFIKNKELIAPLNKEPHAFARFRIDASKYGPELAEEIAIGQSLGVWDEKEVSAELLRQKIAHVVQVRSDENYHWADIAFPHNIWLGKLQFLITILFGKMSFYEGVQISDVWFSEDCFGTSSDKLGAKLCGPRHSTADLRSMTQAPGTYSQTPLLMGILKPNVAMSAVQISDLYVEAAEAGVHLLKDDEIRHDSSPTDILDRVALVANRAAKNNLKTIYAPHLQLDGEVSDAFLKQLENAGARALLVNVWPNGIGSLQRLRARTNLVLMAHPALAGAFGIRSETATLHPRVTLGQLLRAAGADLSLFPSPYGKLGLPKQVALDISQACLTSEKWPIKGTTPVPSAGIKPEHGPMAIADFGNDFVLNAGTGIFAGTQGASANIKAFRAALYGESL